MLNRRQALVRAALTGAAVTGVGLTAACSAGGDNTGGADGSGNGSGSGSGSGETLRISAIPDQDPDALTEREEAFAAHLTEVLGIDVEYVPVPDYAASVTLFGAGDLDLVFYGGLTGVQAQLQNPGATVVAQRDIDPVFTSVFIAHAEAGIEPADSVDGLSAFAGKRFTFGSETSTSGRLMPSYFLSQAGVAEADLAGEPGFSGSHDATIELVASGSYEGGALNSQVWRSRLEAGEVDTDAVTEVLVSPEYHDYHWLLRGDADERFGDGFTQQLTDAMLTMHESEEGLAVVESYGAEQFIEANGEDYQQIEEVARELGLIG